MALAASTGLLLFLPPHTSRKARLALATVAAVAIAMMAGARPIDTSESNDILGYYENYQQLLAGDFGQLTNFGGGLEVTVPLLFWVWGLLLPQLSTNGLMFCLSLTSSLLFMVWVEKTFYREQDMIEQPALMGICILMLNLYFATQLSRQFLALIVLLFAMSARGRAWQTAYVLLACSCHLTALLFYGIYLLAKRGIFGWLCLVILALAFRLFFVQLVSVIDLVPLAVAEKLVYYVDYESESGMADLTSLRMIGLLAVISILGFVLSNFRPPRRTRPWLMVAWVTGVIHLLLLPIPLASLRVTLMVHSVVPGLVAYKMLARKSRLTMPLVLGALFTYKIVTLTTTENSGNLLSTWSMLTLFIQ